MAYWCGVAFGFGVAPLSSGLGAIPVTGDETLTWLKWGGAVVGLSGGIGAYIYRKRTAPDPQQHVALRARIGSRPTADIRIREPGALARRARPGRAEAGACVPLGTGSP